MERMKPEGRPAADAADRARILVVASRFPLASETFVRTKCAALVALGHEVDILALSEGDGAEEDFDRAAGLAARTRTARIHSPLAARILQLPFRVARIARSDLGAAFGAISPRGGRRALSGQLAAIGDALAGVPRPDLVFAEFGPAGAVACAMRDAGIVDAPILTSFYGYDVTRALRHGRGPYARLFREGELFLPNSRHLAGLLVRSGAPEARVVVHRLGIDLARFPERAHRAPQGSPRMLAVGRFVEKKGFAHLLRAMAIAGERCAFELRLIGDGPLAPDLRSLVSSLGLSNRVEFAGWRAHTEVAREMAAADLVAVPSVEASDGDMEGVPLVAIEAMATGLPVLASRHGGLPELIEDGVHGILCAERDERALADALVALSEEPTRTRLGSQSRLRVQADFDARALAAQAVGLGRALR